MNRLLLLGTLLSALPLVVNARGSRASPRLPENVAPKPEPGWGPTPKVLGDYQVDLWSGVHQGFLTENNKYIKFSNIPYAEPPVKDLRWIEPQYVSERREDINYGSNRTICPQYQVGWVPPAKQFLENMFLELYLDDKWADPIGPEDYESFLPKQSLHEDSNEDCLYLDVVVPKKVWDNRASRTIKAAVLVWIHGGGYIFGSKDDIGSPQGLLDAAENPDDVDLIFVSINYRLGAFGWLAGDKYEREGGVPNLGLLDQNFALQWVKDNIGLFGGSPTRISVMGQSAGASSILHHITAPRAYTPVFQSAVIQSPGFFPAPNKTQHNLVYEQILDLAGAKDLDALAEVSTKTLMGINANITFNSSYGLFNFGPSVGGNFVPDLPSKRLGDGEHHRGIGLLLGHTKFDGLLFTPPWIRSNLGLRAHVRKMYPGVPVSVLNKIWDKYPVDFYLSAKEKILKVADFLDDVAIQCNTHFLTEAILKTQQIRDRPIFRYTFNVVPAIHGADLPYTYFPNFVTKPPVDPNLAKFWQSAIVNFTRYGEPNDEDKNFWPAYTTSNRKVLNLGADSQWLKPNHDVDVGADQLDRERCDFWQSAPYYAPASGNTVNDMRDQAGQKRLHSNEDL